MNQDPAPYQIWLGGSCDYGHKERAGGAAVVIERDGSTIDSDKPPTAKSANPDLIRQCIEEKKRHNQVEVKIVPYHKSPLLITTHQMATDAMSRIRKEHAAQLKAGKSR